jgi:membrane-bound metal-dependent hydrolase YbcI (DUF457 family)
MFVGHFAAGMIGKRAAPAVSLGTMLLAAMFADVLFCLFLLGGVEHVAIQPGITAVNPLDLYDIPYSHSLLLDFVWAAALAGIYFWRRGDRRGTAVIFAAVLSHWLLDWVSHRPDMPLAPGVSRTFGLGLWDSVGATFAVEGALWVISIVLYARITYGRNRAGVIGFWGMIVVLTALWILSLGGAPPPNLAAVAVVNAILSAMVLGWAYWINRLRPVKV